MFERFTDGSRRVVVLAQEESRLLHHDYIGAEHLLLGLIRAGEGVAAQVLESRGISLEAVRGRVEEIVGRGERPPSGNIPFTARAKKVLELSLREALQLGHNYIGTEHILLGLIREGSGVAAEVLVELGADLSHVREAVVARAGGSPPEPVPISSWAGPGPSPGFSVTGSRDGCSFCGRDLWDVERHVVSMSARICDECVQACRRTIEEATARGAAGHEPLRLPPRVSGPQPPDDTAVTAVADAFTIAFGEEATDEERARHLEGGTVLAPLIGQARARYPRASGAVVQQMRFVEPGRAQVRFAILFDGGGLPLEGECVRHGDRWQVSRGTVSQFLSMAGMTLPDDPEA